MYAITLPWEQSNNTLMWAIETRCPLRLTVRLGREWMELSSQFLSGQLLRCLVVSRFPEPWTDRMLAGQLLPCSFRKGHKKYLFVSAVMEQTKAQVDGQEQEAYVLAWPECLQQMQRRYYYRAWVPSQYSLSVKVWEALPALGQAPSGDPLAVGKLINVSAGGALVEVASPDSLAMDCSYLAEIELPKPEPAVLVLARTKRMEEEAADRGCRYGLQFLSLDHSPRGQETMMRLARVANFFRNQQMPEHVGEQV